MKSLATRFSAETLEARGLDPDRPPEDCRSEHWTGCGGDAGVLVLSQLFFRSGERFSRVYSLDRIDEQWPAPVALRGVTAALEETGLWPTCLTYFGGGVWGVGAAKQVVAPADAIRCGVLLFDLESPDDVRFFPNVGSRFSVARDQPVVSTVHHNCESRHSVTFDDGVCSWLQFDGQAESEKGLGRCKLLAATDDVRSFPFGFPSLDESHQAPSLKHQLYADPDRRAALRARIGIDESLLGDEQLFNCMELQTDHVSTLPHGRILCSLWNTSRHALNDFTYVVIDAGGNLKGVLDDVEPRSRTVWCPRLGALINVGTTRSVVCDASGGLIAQVDHPPRSASRFKRFRLAGHDESAGFVIDSPWTKQTNSLCLIPAPDSDDPTEFVRGLHRGVGEHDEWYGIQKRSQGGRPELWKAA